MKEENYDEDTRDVMRGSLVNFLGIITRSVGVLFFVILGRLYGPEITGLFLLSRTFIDMLSKLAIMGLDRVILILGAESIAHQKVSSTNGGFQKIFIQCLFSGSLFCFLLMLFSRQLIHLFAGSFLEKPEALDSLKIMMWGIPLLFLSALFVYSVRAFRIMRSDYWVKSVTEPLVQVILGVGFYYGIGGIRGLAYSYIITLLCSVFVSFIFFRKFSITAKDPLRAHHVKMAFKEADEWKRIYRLAMPVGLGDLLNQLIQRIDMMMIGHYLDLATVGIYGIAQEVAFSLKKVRQSFDPILLPVISSAKSLNNKKSLLSQYQNVTRWVLLIDLFVAGVVILGGESLLKVFGKDFSHGGMSLALLVLSVTVSGVLGVAELFVMIDKPWINLYNSLFILATNVLFNVLLIPKWGMVGAATSILLAYLLLNSLRLYQVYKLYQLQPWTDYHTKACVAFGLPVGIFFLIKTVLHLGHHVYFDLGSMIVFSFFYVGLLLAFGMAPIERTWLKKLGL